jgi:hypothetical protein
MKAIARKPVYIAPLLAALAASLVLAGCSERRIVPAPAPSQTPTAAPAPPRASGNWRDVPITPGDWSWSIAGGRSTSSFAGGQFVMRCNLPERTVTLWRAGSGNGQVPMTVLTETVIRPLTGTVQAGSTPGIAVTLNARDPLLDAMAFSRGRFAVETAGLASLYIPSWPEVSRVLEDCR